jgi:hypothetical protein
MRRPVIVNEAAAVMRDDDEDVQHPERARRNPKTEFQQQFVRDSFLAPERVFMRHPAAQLAQLFWNREPPRPRLPPPQEPKKTARCQRISVSGRTTTSAARQSNQRERNANVSVENCQLSGGE